MKSIKKIFVYAALLFAVSTSVQAYPCGDGICHYEESPYSCPQDCGDPNTGNPPPSSSGNYCGDGMCTTGEDFLNCGIDCQETPGGPGPDNPTPPSVHHETCDNNACGWPLIVTDADYDGIPDRLEALLAHKFFPNLWMRDDQYNSEVFYGSPQLGPEYTIPYRINFDLISNLFDSEVYETACKYNKGNTCLEYRIGLPFKRHFPKAISASASRVGDSEFIAFVLLTEQPFQTAQHDPDAWTVLMGRYYHGEHHWQSNTDTFADCNSDTGLCSYYYTADKNNVWIANRSHGPYMNFVHCTNYFNGDNCHGTHYNAKNDVHAFSKLQNIGELTHPIDSVILAPNDIRAPYDIRSTTNFGDAYTYYYEFFYDIGW